MKKAFLVGINDYASAPLNGCVNDCLLMYKILSEKFGFNNNDIDIITDRQCTKSNIISGLKKLISNTTSGDTILFHYSGHGSQVVVNDWTNNPEPDGRDEILCPYDLDWNNPLRDNDLNDIFKSIPKGVKPIILLDCCHSGSGLRDNPLPPTSAYYGKFKNKFIPPPISNMLSNPLVSLDDHLNFVFPESDRSNVQTQLKKFMVDTIEQADCILLSGCRDNQTSADAFISGRYHGAFTFSLIQTLSKFNFKITYYDLITNINAAISKMGFKQTPQLECKQEYFSKLFLE